MHRRARTGAPRGFSLIIAMLMLAVIGLASATILRNATSGDQVASNNRLQTQANQYAQLALRYCERQLALDAGARSVPLFSETTPAAWSLPRNWTTGGPQPAHTLSAADMGGSTPPRAAPQCMIEASALQHVYTVTARGFSPDFRADAGTGATRTGSVMWLQATLYAESADAVPGDDTSGRGAGAGQGDAAPPAAACAGACGLTVRQRLWQQLLTPPF